MAKLTIHKIAGPNFASTNLYKKEGFQKELFFHKSVTFILIRDDRLLISVLYVNVYQESDFALGGQLASQCCTISN
jgi:hypothetical protein